MQGFTGWGERGVINNAGLHGLAMAEGRFPIKSNGQRFTYALQKKEWVSQVGLGIGGMVGSCICAERCKPWRELRAMIQIGLS